MLTYDSTGNQIKGSSPVLSAFYATRHEDTTLVSGTLLPSGKIRVGVVPQKVESQSDKEYERTASGYTWDVAEWEDDNNRSHVAKFLNEKSASPLGLSAVQNCHKQETTRHGLRGISARGRETVKESAYLLERRYGRRLGFYTLTCPYTDPESIYSYNQNIAYIQRSYFQEIKRAYKQKGVRWSYVSVLEIQAERYAKTGVPVLHIHYLAPCYVPGTWKWVLTADALRAIWKRVLANVLGFSRSTNASIDAATVKSSAVGYIAKYLSKGGGEVDFLAQTCPDQLPSQWWSTSRNVRECLARNTVILPQPIAQYLFFKPETDPSEILHILYRTEAYALWNGIELHVGFSGQMNPQGAKCLRNGDVWTKNI